MFPVGHVAQVEMNSDFIDLGDIAGDSRAKVIKTLNWNADLPPGARIQARTRSGNELKENFSFLGIFLQVLCMLFLNALK